MTTQLAISAIKAHLEAQSAPWPVAVYDGEPPEGAQTPYICIYDQTAGTVRGKYVGGVRKVRIPFQLSCVARTRDGLRSLIAVARAVLDWAPMSGASPIVEDGSNPIITESVGNDQRLTAPLTMHSYLPA